MNIIEQFLAKEAKIIDKEISIFLPKKLNKSWIDFVASKPEYSYGLKTAEESITKPVHEFLSRGGKRWRPALMLLSCDAVGGKSSSIKEFSVLPELIHSGTLLVDDVEDNSLLRRGKPALHTIYGIDIAVNAGNMLYFLPLKVIEKFLKGKKIPEKKALAIYKAYSEELIRLSLGQAMDIYWHKGNAKTISEAQYLQMCVYKTGSLAKFSAKLGAILGNASEKQTELLGNFAASIGVAFQIQDDILNIRPSGKWGKELGDDISEGKRTLLVIYALKHTSKEKAKRLIQILNMHTKNASSVKEAISIIAETGAIEYAKAKAESILKSSWKKLDPALKESKAKGMLRAFADYLVERRI